MEGRGYWARVEPHWNAVDIHHGPERFLATLATLSLPDAHLLATHWCQSEACNGGFHQFFTNPTGVLAPEALDGFDAMGRTDLGSLLRDAMAWFGPAYPRDQGARLARLERVGGENRAAWDPFVKQDDAFYECLARERFEASADRYASSTGRS